MVFTLLASGSTIADNQTGTSPLEWSELFTNSFVIEEGSWFSTGQLQLQLQLFFSVTVDPLGQKANTERYLNPVQLQIGHWAVHNEEFTLDDGRIKYLNQAHNFRSPQIQISNTRADARINLGLVQTTQPGHAQQSTSLVVCGTSRGLVPPPPSATALDGSFQIPVGSICLRTFPGQSEYQEIEPFLPLQKEITISSREMNFPDKVSGVLWTGYRLEVGWLIGYNQAATSAIAKPAIPYVVGEVKPLPYSYSCDFGTPVPGPQNCPPGVPFTITYQGVGGTPIFACAEGSSA